jgi:hypothetical protein
MVNELYTLTVEMPPSAIRSSKTARKVGKKGLRFVGESAFTAASRRAANTRRASDMRKRMGSTTIKAHTSRKHRKVKVAPMNVNAGLRSLRHSMREKKSVTRYDPSSTVKSVSKSTRARRAPSNRTTKKNLNSLAKLMENTNFNLGHSRTAPASTKWPPSGR